jgi:hypothetical protein
MLPPHDSQHVPACCAVPCCAGEGVPRSILPDHEGRADYHGQSINMAARFMDKGARGGQIACTLELAQQAMAVWAAGGGSASFTDLHSPLAATVSIAEGQEHGHAAGTAAEAFAQGSGGQGEQALQQIAAVGSSCEGARALDIELPHEQAAAVAVTATAARDSSTLAEDLSLNSCSSAQPAAGPVGPASYWAAATAGPGSPPGAADGVGSGGSIRDQGSRSVSVVAGQSAAAATGAGGPELDVVPQRQMRGSWPGGLSPTAQQQGQGQQHYPRIPAPLWLPCSRSNSQDGANLLKQGSRSRSQQQQQQQQSSRRAGMAAGSSSALSQQQLSTGDQLHHQQQPPPPVAPSPFVMSDVVRVPFRVEVHRLGLFRFKGGPAQQEMVQVLPTHLLGRAQFIASETPPQASRKGQVRLGGGDPCADVGRQQKRTGCCFVQHNVSCPS